jgi:hypothetical protein
MRITTHVTGAGACHESKLFPMKPDQQHFKYKFIEFTDRDGAVTASVEAATPEILRLWRP